jgi:Uma2 family endonuclease
MAMSTMTGPERSTGDGEARILLSGVDWPTFKKLTSESTGARFAYDQGVLEITAPGPLHESDKALLGQFVRIVARTLRIPRLDMGSTTWESVTADRGLEADECFYFDQEKIAAAAAALARRSNDPADYPAPDLASEVDLSPPKLDRSAIYAALRIPEIWRFDGISLVIERLNHAGEYDRVERSSFLPVRDFEIRRWLLGEDAIDRSSWEERLAEWALAELKARNAVD